MSAFASEMDRLGMTEKILVRDGKRLIRQDLKASQPAASDLLQAPESVEVCCASPMSLLCCTWIAALCGGKQSFESTLEHVDLAPAPVVMLLPLPYPCPFPCFWPGLDPT